MRIVIVFIILSTTLTSCFNKRLSGSEYQGKNTPKYRDSKYGHQSWKNYSPRYYRKQSKK